jgi:non-homologous end joining protein Ku
MPRATWKGFLRLSLVSCPVYLLPAATKTKSIRLHQVWVPRSEPHDEPDIEDQDEGPAPPPATRPAARTAVAPGEPEPVEPEAAQAATRIALRPVDRNTGEAIERDEVRKGYQFDRGQFVTFGPEELKALVAVVPDEGR